MTTGSKRVVETWKVDRLGRERTRLTFPDYQRQPHLWTREKKALLIDSVFRDIDIPKLYFNETPTGALEVVDGQQRIWAFLDFMDDKLPCLIDGKSRVFSDLTPAQLKIIKNFELQVTKFHNADNAYLRDLFQRLQWGLLLITGEKLNASVGQMKDFIFKQFSKQKFFQSVSIPDRRFSRESLCSQVAINMFSLEKTKTFSRTRAEDLLAFYEEYERPVGEEIQIFRKVTREMTDVAEDLAGAFGSKASELRNRSFVLSVFILFSELRRGGRMASSAERRKYVDFCIGLWKRLKEEAKLGIERTNQELYSFENLIGSAPGERYQIERRHVSMREYFETFRESGRLPGE